mmetsp:Transcript_6445/g.14230  ORF Transcript_6445/g.14230 Transcript_6445/m.14230 type:complete len:254 (+) Transcript_6445:237-998(+)
MRRRKEGGIDSVDRSRETMHVRHRMQSRRRVHPGGQVPMRSVGGGTRLFLPQIRPGGQVASGIPQRTLLVVGRDDHEKEIGRIVPHVRVGNSVPGRSGNEQTVRSRRLEDAFAHRPGDVGPRRGTVQSIAARRRRAAASRTPQSDRARVAVKRRLALVHHIGTHQSDRTHDIEGRGSNVDGSPNDIPAKKSRAVANAVRIDVPLLRRGRPGHPHPDVFRQGHIDDALPVGGGRMRPPQRYTHVRSHRRGSERL